MTQERELNYGCEPNCSKPYLMQDMEEMAIPWDAEDKPRLCTWETLKPYLESRVALNEASPKNLKMWWEIATKLGFEPEELLIPTQGSIGSCAGVSYFDRCYLIQLLKQVGNHFSEQKVVRVNALATWLKSKGWSRWGGQTISAVVKEGVETGVYAVENVGEYSYSWYNRSLADKFLPEAEKRQMGACLVPDKENKVDVIRLALKAGHVVEIGNSVAVSDGTKTDKNGVACVTCSGGWSHATMFSEYKVVNDTEYFRWENSHGKIYPNNAEEPRIGAWMTLDTLRRFTSSSFCDLAVVTYVEAPYDMKLKATLNPETDA